MTCPKCRSESAGCYPADTCPICGWGEGRRYGVMPPAISAQVKPLNLALARGRFNRALTPTDPFWEQHEAALRAEREAQRREGATWVRR